ncbi:MAG TPA: hypothetical protein VFI76_02010 [Terrimicrobiaceae bacterium]|nr:hypothetical protein [Terrimicrobiaceae bacterium]
MATKANFSAEEWGKLLSSPMIAGMAITAADPSGVWGLLKEGMASGWALVEARQHAQTNPLVRAVAEDFATAEGRAAARSALQARFTNANLKGLKDAALTDLKTISGIVDAKAPEDASAFKVWLQEVAQKAAEAGTEGGFLGFGGVAVSDSEKATLVEISTALRQTGTAST